MAVTRSAVARALQFLLAAASLTCGGKDNTGPVPVATVTVTSPTTTVDELDSLQLTATPKDAQGNPLSGRVITWSTNAGTKASISATGLVHAFQGGTITVTATCEGLTGNTTVTIVVPVATILLDRGAVTLAVGDTTRLHATLLGPTGDQPTDTSVKWKSSDSIRATVSSSGLVTGRYPGSATITATAGTHSAPAQISIPTPVASVSIAPDSDTLAEGDSTTLQATALDSAGSPLAARGFIWQSMDTGIAYVVPLLINTARVTASHAGVTWIVGASEGRRDSAAIRVVHLPVTEVVVSIDSATILLHNSVSVGATTRDSAGGNLVSRQIHWSTTNPAVAVPTPDTGSLVTVTILASGVAGVVATSEGKSDTAFITGEEVTYTSIGSGILGTCATTADSLVFCWSEGSAPTAPAMKLPLGTITVGQNHLCGLANGTAYCGASPGTLTAVPGGHAFTSVAAGSFHTCAIAADSTAWCWGLNDGGQLGDSSLLDSPTPVQVAGSHRFIAISAGAETSCGLVFGGTVFCWGQNFDGVLGTGDATSFVPYPRPVAGGMTFTTISMGLLHACALRSGGQAYCWGDNQYDQLGTGAADSVPTAVSGGLTFVAIKAGASFSCGSDAGGIGYCWGDNSRGQLGNPLTLVTSSTPVVVSGGLTFQTFGGGFHDNCALTTNGAYCWGSFQTVPHRLAGQP